MQVRQGYKQTEVGKIPQDWDVIRLGDVVEKIIGGGTPSRSNPDYWGNEIPWVTVKDFATFNPCLTQEAITKAGLKNSASHLIPKGTVITSTRMALGKAVIYDVDVSINQDLKAVFPKKDVDSLFLYYWFQTHAEYIASLGSGSTVMGISLPDLKNITFLKASRQEQEAIATALSDTDALIASLDKLIAKKRDIKQATMQQLLTGKTRLPGFSGEWEVKTLGDLGSTFGGLTGKTKADFGEGSGHYVTFMNVMTNVVIDCGTFERVKVSPTESQNKVVKGDLLFNGSSETPEEVAMCAVMKADVPNLFLNSFCFGFRFHDGAEADGLFLACYFRSKEGRELMKSLAQGSTRYNLSKVAFLKSSLPLPRLPEQTAIAAVLSDIDAEISALEKQRDKTLALKQGMMQELLTGRIRLV